MSQVSDSRPAVKELISAIRGVFSKYTHEAREKAWRGIQSTDGKNDINKLIRNPKVPITGTYRLIGFKEWFNQTLN